jgi:hypothetical protein
VKNKKVRNTDLSSEEPGPFADNAVARTRPSRPVNQADLTLVEVPEVTSAEDEPTAKPAHEVRGQVAHACTKIALGAVGAEVIFVVADAPMIAYPSVAGIGTAAVSAVVWYFKTKK